MRVVIATVQVPFVRGGAELLAENLQAAIRRAGHEAEIAAIPFNSFPAARIPDHMLACRLLDLSASNGVPIDRVIGLKFPAYLIPHPSKVLWLLHQHRAAYDLWNSPLGDLAPAPDGRLVREAIHHADRSLLPEAEASYTISRTVSRRLEQFSGVASTPLYHPPPGAELLAPGEAGDYLLFPSRVNPIKRQALVVDALALTKHPVRVVFMGAADQPDYGRALQLRAAQRAGDRAHWTGATSESERLRLYANCRGVIFPPLDEDYGYVTLEAMLCAKPVLTCTDSGGPLEFVEAERTGLVTAPDARAMADGLDRLWADPAAAQRMGRAGRADYAERRIGWPQVLQCLLA